jgi:hypothetical protein
LNIFENALALDNPEENKAGAQDEDSKQPELDIQNAKEVALSIQEQTAELNKIMDEVAVPNDIVLQIDNNEQDGAKEVESKALLQYLSN